MIKHSTKFVNPCSQNSIPLLKKDTNSHQKYYTMAPTLTSDSTGDAGTEMVTVPECGLGGGGGGVDVGLLATCISCREKHCIIIKGHT